MHLAAHLTDCIRNHGPVYGFWLFAFERMNGIAVSFHTNTHNIPIQIMRKLTSMQSTDSSLWPSEFQNEFSSLLHEHKKGTLSDFSFLDKNEIKPLRPIFQKVFDEIELERIHQVLHTTYDGNNYHFVQLHKYTNAICQWGAIKIASEKSWYGNSPKVIVNNQLVEIIRFVCCTVIVSCSNYTSAGDPQIMASTMCALHSTSVPWMVWFSQASMGSYFTRWSQILLYSKHN